MTYKRYDHPTESLQDKRGHDGIRLPDGVTVNSAAEDLYSRVGGRFEVTWEPWATAEPIVNTETLPSGVSKADVETALTNMKNEGVL